MRLIAPLVLLFSSDSRRRTDIYLSKMFIGGLNWETTEGTYIHEKTIIPEAISSDSDIFRHNPKCTIH